MQSRSTPPARLRAVVFDLDRTLVDSREAEPFRRTRQWAAAYQVIPRFPIYEGVEQLLADLRAAQIPVAIVTSSPRTYCEAVLSHTGWRVDATVCYHDIPRGQHKPHPAPMVLAAQRLRVPTAEAVSLGDAITDAESAYAAGMPFIGALWGAQDADALQAVCHICAHNAQEVRDFLVERLDGFEKSTL